MHSVMSSAYTRVCALIDHAPRYSCTNNTEKHVNFLDTSCSFWNILNYIIMRQFKKKFTSVVNDHNNNISFY